MSKFEYGLFYGEFDELAVSKEKYTKDEAIEIAKMEFEHRKHEFLAIGNGFVRHRAGVNEDLEPCVGGWLENMQNVKKAVPAGCSM